MHSAKQREKSRSYPGHFCITEKVKISRNFEQAYIMQVQVMCGLVPKAQDYLYSGRFSAALEQVLVIAVETLCRRLQIVNLRLLTSPRKSETINFSLAYYVQEFVLH